MTFPHSAGRLVNQNSVDLVNQPHIFLEIIFSLLLIQNVVSMTRKCHNQAGQLPVTGENILPLNTG